MIAVGIGQKSKKTVNQDMLKQIAGENVIYLHDYKTGLDEKMDAVVNLVCSMYLTTISRYSTCISALNVPVACLIVTDEEFVKSNSKR